MVGVAIYVSIAKFPEVLFASSAFPLLSVISEIFTVIVFVASSNWAEGVNVVVQVIFPLLEFTFVSVPFVSVKFISLLSKFNTLSLNVIVIVVLSPIMRFVSLRVTLTTLGDFVSIV